MEANDVLKQMDEIERTVYATQSWWPELRRLLVQAQARDEATQPSAQADLAGVSVQIEKAAKEIASASGVPADKIARR